MASTHVDVDLTAPTALALDGLRHAPTFPITNELIRSCLLAGPVEELFDAALRDGLDSLPRQRRSGALGGVTGHVAESVVELVLADQGCHVVWHFTGPGRHGVDLLVLTPAGQLIAVEVKGTLRSGRWPRLSRRELSQMSCAWLDKRDNPGMVEWGLDSQDVYGAVVLVNLADRALRAAVTSDFVTLAPVTALDLFADLAWLDATPQAMTAQNGRCMPMPTHSWPDVE